MPLKEIKPKKIQESRDEETTLQIYLLSSRRSVKSLSEKRKPLLAEQTALIPWPLSQAGLLCLLFSPLLELGWKEGGWEEGTGCLGECLGRKENLPPASCLRRGTRAWRG